eukprot:2945012-Amphidinium_carterae.1
MPNECVACEKCPPVKRARVPLTTLRVLATRVPENGRRQEEEKGEGGHALSACSFTESHAEC